MSFAGSVRTVICMKTHLIIKSTSAALVSGSILLGSLLGVASPSQAAAKPGCADVKVIEEFAKGLGGMNPMVDPKGQATKMKASAAKMKAMVKTAPKELKADYEFMAKLMGDLATSFGKINPNDPQTIAKGLDPLTKGATKLGQVGPHFSAYAIKNCK